MIHIAIVTHNRLELTKRCLYSLYAHTAQPFTLSLVDNASTDGSVDFLQDFTKAHTNANFMLLRQNMGVAVAANLAWASNVGQEAEYYLKLDNDVEILHPNWLNNMLALLAANPELASIGHALLARMPREEKRLQTGQSFWQADLTNGGCVLIPKRTHKVLGFWNEDYGKYGFEDLEYGARARQAGFVVGHAAGENMVQHLGYVDEAQLDRNLELMKNASIHSPTSGEKLYIINRFLFTENIRPLYVRPKYVYDGTKFRVDVAYKPIIAIQQKLLEETSYSIEGEKIALNLRALQK